MNNNLCTNSSNNKHLNINIYYHQEQKTYNYNFFKTFSSLFKHMVLKNFITIFKYLLQTIIAAVIT